MKTKSNCMLHETDTFNTEIRKKGKIYVTETQSQRGILQNDKMVIQWKDITILELYEPDNMISTYMKQKLRNTGFPQYPKVEQSSKNFHKPKWCKVKKQLPFFS